MPNSILSRDGSFNEFSCIRTIKCLFVFMVSHQKFSLHNTPIKIYQETSYRTRRKALISFRYRQNQFPHISCIITARIATTNDNLTGLLSPVQNIALPIPLHPTTQAEINPFAHPFLGCTLLPLTFERSATKRSIAYRT